MAQARHTPHFFVFLCLSIFSLNAGGVKVDPAKPSSTAPAKPQGPKAMSSKMAFFDIRQILPMENNADLSKASHEWRDFVEQLKTKIAPYEREIQDLEDTLRRGKTEFENLQKSQVASREALENKGEILMGIQRQWQLKMNEREQLVNQDVSKAQSALLPKLNTILDKIAADEGWDFIAHKEAFAYANNRYDLTDKILAVLNRNYDNEQKAKKAGEAKKA
jgi:Skp family chaperone for outer membrane proteins